jgi:hypothetical protein
MGRGEPGDSHPIIRVGLGMDVPNQVRAVPEHGESKM